MSNEQQSHGNGRPAARSVRINVSVTPELKKQIEADAARAGLSTSSYAATVLAAAHQRGGLKLEI